MVSKIEPIKVTPYLSVVEGRRPRQKTHTSLAHAKNAFDTPRFNPLVEGYNGRQGAWTHGWGTLYEFKDGDWVVLYDVRQPEQSDGVQGKWKVEYETRPWRLEDD